jgi:Short C-terminal domain
MTATELHIGERVGIKDGADFLHWSRFGAIAGIADGRETRDGSATTFDVLEDGQPEAVHMVSSLLVGLGQPGEENGQGPWTAQAFPTNGDRPGLVMYFENAADLLEFVVEFADLRLDEKLKVHGPAWTAEERKRLLDAGVEVGHDGDAKCPASLVDELAKLANLRRQGSLSESEFQAAKARLLST